MDTLRTVIGLTLLATVAVECTFAPRRGLNGQFYTGSGVGPLGLFRSSADNARIVNGALRGHPISRSLALAFGDEFPSLRDEIIARANGGERYGSGSGGYGGGSSSGGGINSITSFLNQGSSGSSSSSSGSSSSSSSSSSSGPLSGLRSLARNNPFFNYQNYLSYDRGNQKKEYEDPYVRDNPLRAVTGLLPSGGLSGLLSGGGSGGSGGGILSRITGLFSSLTGGGGGSSSGSSSSGGIQAFLEAQNAAAGGAGSSASGSSNNFRITVDTPTRAPATSSNTVEEAAARK